MKRYSQDKVASGCDMLEDKYGEWVRAVSLTCPSANIEDVIRLLKSILDLQKVPVHAPKNSLK
jgi:hypothetical protein